MKKVLIVLLSVLLALSFISCEKDKSGEVIQNYEDFKKSQSAYWIASDFCDDLVYEYIEDGKVDKKLSEDDKPDILAFLKNYSNNDLQKILDVDADCITISSVESVSGELKGETESTEEYWKEEYTASDIVINFKYTITTYVYESGTKKDSAETSDPIEGELKINMKSSFKSTEKGYTCSISSLSLQGTSYKDITYSYEGKKYTSATVGGADVELRLLNAGY